MTELEQELLELRTAIKEMKALRERLERINFLRNLNNENKRVAKYFMLATLLDAAAVNEVLMEIKPNLTVELADRPRTKNYMFSKLCIGNAAVADITINRTFETEIMNALHSHGIPIVSSEVT